MVKYICRACNKEIKHGHKFFHVVRELVFPNNIVRCIGEKIMKKLIIKDGKLVKQEEAPNRQVIEETKTKVFSKSEVAPQPQPVEEPEEDEPEELEEEEPSQEQLQKDIESYKKIKAMLEREEQLKREEEEDLKAEFDRHKAEEEARARQATEDYDQLHNTPELIVFKFVLQNSLVLNFNVVKEESEAFYAYVAKAMEESKTIKIENKIILVSSILFFEFNQLEVPKNE